MLFAAPTIASSSIATARCPATASTMIGSPQNTSESANARESW